MDEHGLLAKRFEENRDHLRAVAYRMLGSVGEADDAVQEAWLRLSRTDAGAIGNLGGWLTTVVARVCLDMLRSRTSRREEALDAHASQPIATHEPGSNPEEEAALADSVGLALLVVLDRLTPAERLAFVMHDMFAVPFEEIAPIVGRSPDAARQLASRARRRVQGPGPISGADLTRNRKVVDAFLTALRDGDFDGLLAVLDADVVVRADSTASPTGAPREVHGATTAATGAMQFSQYARFVQPAFVDGEVGLLWAPSGRLLRALKMTIAGERIVEIDVVADPERLKELDLAIVND
jgi:RNA polymerase sigma-70 factor (ECF subfamily)